MKKVISVLTLSLLITTFGASTAFAGEGYYIHQKMLERMEEKQTPSQETCKSKEQSQEACKSMKQDQKLKQETKKVETSKLSITPIAQLKGGR